MTDLLEETLEALRFYSKEASDVLWVGSDDGKFAISWKEFESSPNLNYDSMYFEFPCCDLVIVGKNWWLKRHVEINSTGGVWSAWRYVTKPKKSRYPQKISNFISDDYRDKVKSANKFQTKES